MTTETTKQTRRQRMIERMKLAYIALGARPGEFQALRDRVKMIEKRCHSYATAECSYPQTETQQRNMDRQREKYLKELRAMFPNAAPHIFINRDPRGYALKIDNENDQARALIETSGAARDWGGYGLLTPEAYQ